MNFFYILFLFGVFNSFVSDYVITNSANEMNINEKKKQLIQNAFVCKFTRFFLVLFDLFKATDLSIRFYVFRKDLIKNFKFKKENTFTVLVSVIFCTHTHVCLICASRDRSIFLNDWNNLKNSKGTRKFEGDRKIKFKHSYNNFKT
ncbi:hypothetical protein BpHYR1_052757 [Brachionus plicatilis]|uniref:Uncharacterized protein n=1 Tax=Brachionus plicatilis TaxID=10195 RepID=A0A3M7PR17_BRAPC|nr:hypothetical protein BpHYR1_052757 [Brachionus plicatilis]